MKKLSKKVKTMKSISNGFYYSEKSDVMLERIGKCIFDGTEAVVLKNNQVKKIYGNLKRLKWAKIIL